MSGSRRSSTPSPALITFRGGEHTFVIEFPATESIEEMRRIRGLSVDLVSFETGQGNKAPGEGPAAVPVRKYENLQAEQHNEDDWYDTIRPSAGAGDAKVKPVEITVRLPDDRDVYSRSCRLVVRGTLEYPVWVDAPSQFERPGFRDKEAEFCRDITFVMAGQAEKEKFDRESAEYKAAGDEAGREYLAEEGRWKAVRAVCLGLGCLSLLLGLGIVACTSFLPGQQGRRGLRRD